MNNENKPEEEKNNNNKTILEENIIQTAEKINKNKTSITKTNEKNPLEIALIEISSLKDQMLREQAETQNIRRRMQRDLENTRKFALEKIITSLLPIIDNLERAINASNNNEEAKSLIEGIKLTEKSFLDILIKFNVQQLNPINELFDANFHQAITIVPSTNTKTNIVMEVIQKGYTLNHRLIRPAMVIVSKS